jgi:hypothetical protein
MNSKVYFYVLFLAMLYLSVTKFDNFFNSVSIVRLINNELSYESISQEQFEQQFGPVLKKKKKRIAEPFTDSIFLKEGVFHWAVGTESIKERVLSLRRESPIFDRVFQALESSEYPFFIRSVKLEESIGEYSSLYGELRFNTEKMKDFLFDAAVIEEFVHAYQACYYEYGHGQRKKKDYLFALKDVQNETRFKRKLEMGFINWRRFGAKQAFIESEAKLITYLVQNEAASVSVKSILATDMYNSGGSAAFYILPYLNKRNCTKVKRKEKLKGLDDFYVDLDAFMRYQHSFIRHWNFQAPNCSYTKGKLRHRPEGLQALNKTE